LGNARQNDFTKQQNVIIVRSQSRLYTVVRLSSGLTKMFQTRLFTKGDHNEEMRTVYVLCVGRIIFNDGPRNAGERLLNWGERLLLVSQPHGRPKSG